MAFTLPTAAIGATPIALGPVIPQAPAPAGAGGAPQPGAVASGKFAAALDRAGGGAPPVSPSFTANPLQGIMRAVEQIDGQARSVSGIAAKASANGTEMRPSDIIDLTMRCQEFMFQCQLTSNIANRSADGVQQLFRQQG
ncbi:MAG: hypothetical protein ACKVOB_10410 [Sphingomonas sp.]